MIGVLRRLHRILRRIPFLGTGINHGLRLCRNLFWSHRPISGEAASPLPEEYLNFVAKHLAGDSFPFTLVEVGCGDGRVLRKLAVLFPNATFFGIDLQKAAIKKGMEELARQKIGNVQLAIASCLESISLECDFMISRASIIYLDRHELNVFLRKRLPEIRQKLLMHEIISLTSQTQFTHFFAHPIPELVRANGNDLFDSHVKLLSYGPWKNGSIWSGAELVFTRKI